MKPRISASLEEAIHQAKRYRQSIVVVYVSSDTGSSVPPLFRDRKVAVASRMLCSLVILEYFPGNEFFRSRKYPKDNVPAVLFLDTHGNILKSLPGKLDSRQFTPNVQSTKSVAREIAEELPGAIEAAQAAPDEKALLAIARPWLRRHLRGFSEIKELEALVMKAGAPRIEKAVAQDPDAAMRDLELIARDYAGTPVEAAALVEIARIHLKKRDMAAVRRVCTHLLDELPWPENADSHRQAQSLMRSFRQAEIQRRLEILRKREEEKKKKK